MSAPYPTYDDEIAAHYRESGEYHEQPVRLICRICDCMVDEDDTIGEAVCSRCAEFHHLAACDGCGRVAHKNVLTVHNEIGQLTGRMISFRYCHVCQRDFIRKTANA